jgi:hypothetical protein
MSTEQQEPPRSSSETATEELLAEEGDLTAEQVAEQEAAGRGTGSSAGS